MIDHDHDRCRGEQAADHLCHCRCETCGYHRPCPGVAGEDDVGLCLCHIAEYRAMAREERLAALGFEEPPEWVRKAPK
jgi:hypothetical protein